MRTITRIVKRKGIHQRQQRFVRQDGTTGERTAISHVITLADPQNPDSPEGACNLATWDPELANQFHTLDVVHFTIEPPPLPKAPPQAPRPADDRSERHRK